MKATKIIIPFSMLLCTVTLRQKHIQENECVAISETQQWLRVSRDAPEQKILNPTVHQPRTGSDPAT